MNLKNILLMFIIIAAVMAGALLIGSRFSPVTSGASVGAAEQTKACPVNCDKPCCAKKNDQSKCPTDCDKPCCTAKKDADKCPPDCNKPCCTEKNTSPVEDEVPLCCG